MDTLRYGIIGMGNMGGGHAHHFAQGFIKNGHLYRLEENQRGLDKDDAEVDEEKLTAKLPWQLIEGCLATVPDRVLLAGRDPAADLDAVLVSQAGLDRAQADNVQQKVRGGRRGLGAEKFLPP